MPASSQSLATVWARSIGGMSLLLSVVLLAASVIVWIVPVEVIQNWAFEQAGEDHYAQFEAVGCAEALWTASQWLLPILTAVSFWGFRNQESLSVWILSALEDLCAFLTGSRKLFVRPSPAVAVRGTLMAVLLKVWLVLAVVHAAGGVWERARDWPYFRWNSGSVVLPNISDTNRDVIRYLREATPPDSRILVFSDQKLFFLSYYLLPRRLFHPIHEDSEFVIPLPNQARQLAAYRKSDFTAEELAKWRPDYVLEYFEGADYVDSQQRNADPVWVRYWQTRHQSTDLPPAVVILTKVSPAGETP